MVVDVSDTPSKTVSAGTGAPVSTGRSLQWAIQLLFLEAAAIGLYALATVWFAVAADSASVSSAIATPVFFALCAAIAAGLARALGRKKALARSPAIVMQMLLLPIGYSMIAVGDAWLGATFLVIGLLGSGLLLAPSTRTALGLTNRSNGA
jgi:hypothetical protein